MAQIINPIILMTGGENRLKALLENTLTEVTAEDLGTTTEIGKYQFAYKTAITSVTIPTNQITKINDFAFFGCTNLTGSFDLGTTLVAQDAFRETGITKLRCGPQTASGPTGPRLCQNCPNLELIEITEGATQAYTALVSSVPAIQYAILPSTITKIKSGAIVGSIPNLVIKATAVPNTDSVSISGTNLFVPLASISNYEASTYFSSFTKYPIVTSAGEANAYSKCLTQDTEGNLTLWEQSGGIWYNKGIINEF